VRAFGDDVDAVDSFDPAETVRGAAEVEADGVVATRDRTALLAALVAARRGLPGPDPAALLRCQHKPSARAVQASAAPEAVPRFAVGEPPFPPPFVAKPVVGRLSRGVRRVERLEELPEPERDAYAESYERLAELAGVEGLRFDEWLAEELVEGDEATVEGYVHRGRVTVVGVTDSVHYPGTRSFQRFEYPSRLPRARLDELGAVAERVVAALGLDACFFNAELAVPERGPARLIEVNARIASQFAPLVRATHGRSTYDLLFALACGGDPAWAGGEPDGVAVSWVLREFEDARVEAVPGPEPGVELLVEPGRRLSDQGVNDTASFRLAIFVEHGETREEALARCRRRAGALRAGFRLSRA